MVRACLIFISSALERLERLERNISLLVVVKKGIEQIPSVPTLSVFFWKRKRKCQNSNCCSGEPNGPTEREHRQHNGDLGGGETRLNSVFLVLRALRKRHTAADLRPPPPPWTANPQTPAQLSTHTIGLRRWILARTATTTSAWTPRPRNPTSTRGRQRWQQRRCLPSGPGALLHLC